MPERDLTGEQFNLLRVVALVDEPGPETWLCQCVCGSYKRFLSSQLFKNGGAYSCGCYMRGVHREEREFEANAATTMACIFPEEFRLWQKLKSKGKLCQRWANHFCRFMRDMGPQNANGIHRPNNKRLFGPENASWGRKPKDDPQVVRWNGATMRVIEFAREAGIQKQWILDTWPDQKELDGHEIIREQKRMVARRQAVQNKRARKRAQEKQRAVEQAAPYNAPFIPQFMRS